ncbi:MAG: hypothetical protein MZW92_14830 [Comamonadaceae bacterium]|nr:hypothetical protein [Comamonadaceae bacterium]
MLLDRLSPRPSLPPYSCARRPHGLRPGAAACAEPEPRPDVHHAAGGLHPLRRRGIDRRPAPSAGHRRARL